MISAALVRKAAQDYRLLLATDKFKTYGKAPGMTTYHMRVKYPDLQT